MVSRLRITLLLAAGYLLRACGAQSDAPAAGDFLRRNWARSTIIGDYLYIEGGQISQLVQGENNKTAVKNTLSIDLSKTWKPKDVKIKEIPKDVQVVSSQAVFTDSSSNTFYTWGGYVGKGGSPPKQVFKFEADGSGNGSWSSTTEPDIPRSHGGAFVSTPGSGLYFGGIDEETTVSNYEIRDGNFKTGFFKFDFSQGLVGAKQAENHSNFTMYAGSAHYVPKFGTNGLIILLGGNEWEAGADETQDRSMEMLRLVDPVNPEKWYLQKTSGITPDRRRWPCVIGAQGRSNTYEIFMFGGNAGGKVYDDVWILSLPDFIWKEAKYKAGIVRRRTQMSCVVAGQRQMIIVGGVEPNGSKAAFFDKDPFPQGLGIFDLTKLEWKDTFDPGAEAYDSPDVIKSYYGGQVQSCLFPNQQNSTDRNRNRKRPEYGPGVEEFLNSSPNSNVPDDTGNSLSPGAMGGAIGGSIVGAVLIGVAVVLFMRRRKRKMQARRRESEPEAVALNKSDSWQAPTSTTSKPFQLPGEHGSSELSGHVPSYTTTELLGDHHPYSPPVELDTFGDGVHRAQR